MSSQLRWAVKSSIKSHKKFKSIFYLTFLPTCLFEVSEVYVNPFKAPSYYKFCVGLHLNVKFSAFRQARRNGKIRVYEGREVVCAYLSSGYRSIARRCFPNAKIVADKFHVMRLYHFMEFCESVQKKVKCNRKLGYPLVKRKDRQRLHEREQPKSFF